MEVVHQYVVFCPIVGVGVGVGAGEGARPDGPLGL